MELWRIPVNTKGRQDVESTLLRHAEAKSGLTLKSAIYIVSKLHGYGLIAHPEDVRYLLEYMVQNGRLAVSCRESLRVWYNPSHRPSDTELNDRLAEAWVYNMYRQTSIAVRQMESAP